MNDDEVWKSENCNKTNNTSSNYVRKIPSESENLKIKGKVDQ